MAFYIVAFIILFVLSFKGIEKKCFFALLLVLAFFLGFRGENVGDDTSRYISYYYNVESRYGIGYMEIGWNIISEFFRVINLSAYFFHFIVALSTLLLWGIVCDKVAMKNNRVRGYALFFLYSLGFYLYMFNGMRQFLAVSIVMLAFYMLSLTKTRKFVVLIILATFFHESSFLGLLIYPMMKIRLTPLRMILILIVTYIIGLVANESWFYLFAGKYASEIEDFGFRTSILYVTCVGLTTNLFFCWLIYCDKQMLSNIWMKYFFFSIVVMNILSSVVYGPRIVYYFSITQTLSIAIYMARSIKKTIIPIVYLYSIVTFGRYFLPELWKIEGSLIPYYFTFKIFD